MRKRAKQLKKLVELTQKLREATQAADAALDQGLDAMQDLHLAEQRVVDVRAGRSQAVDLAEVERRLDLGD